MKKQLIAIILGATSVLWSNGALAYKTVNGKPAGSGSGGTNGIITLQALGGAGGTALPTNTAIAGQTAPLNPQLQTTTLNQSQINQLGSATNRAFVLESDVSGNQERIRRLNRAARIN